MRLRLSSGMAVLALIAFAGSSAQAFCFKKKCCTPVCCEPAPCASAPAMVEKKVMAPEWVTETRTVKCTEYKMEPQQREITCYERKIEQQERTRTVCKMVAEQQQKTIEYTVCKPVYEDKTVTCTVMVPTQEKRQGVRRVCKLVKSTEPRKVCVDEGHWEEKCCVQYCRKVTCCGCCVVPVNVVKKVWVPNVVEKEIQVEVCKRVMEEQPYEYTVTVCKPEQRTKTVRVCKMVPEKRTKEVTYTVCKPTTEEVKCTVNVCKCVPVKKTVTVNVCVPHEVEKQVQVSVCKMVEKTIMVPAGNCCH